MRREMSQDYRLFALEDPVPPTDEEVEARLQDARDRALLDKDISDGSPRRATERIDGGRSSTDRDHRNCSRSETAADREQIRPRY